MSAPRDPRAIIEGLERELAAIRKEQDFTLAVIRDRNRERDALAAELVGLREYLDKPAGNDSQGNAVAVGFYTPCGLSNRISHAAEHAKAILATHDATKDAEIAALSAGLFLAHTQLRNAGLDEEADQTMGLDACKRALGEHDAALKEELATMELRAISAEAIAGIAPYKPRSGTIEVTLVGGERAKPFAEPFPDCTGKAKR